MIWGLHAGGGTCRGVFFLLFLRVISDPIGPELYFASHPECFSEGPYRTRVW